MTAGPDFPRDGGNSADLHTFGFHSEDCTFLPIPCRATISTEQDGSTMAVDGTWTIRFTTPGGERQADLVFSADGSALTGSFDGTPFEDGRAEGNEIGFSAKLTSPFKMKIKCAATIDGDTISGKAKAAMMTIPFTGTRKI